MAMQKRMQSVMKISKHVFFMDIPAQKGEGGVYCFGLVMIEVWVLMRCKHGYNCGTKIRIKFSEIRRILLVDSI